MSIIIDSYPETNQNVTNTVYSAVSQWGQSITGDGSALQWIQWYIQKYGSPTGSCYAKLYAHSGTFGTSSIPTGAALAISDPINVATLSTSLTLVRFKFLTPYTLVNGTKYCILLEFTGGDASNRIQIGYDNSSPSHAGNAFYYTASYTAFPAGDTCFYARSSTVTSAIWSAHTTQDNMEHSIIVSGKVYIPALKTVGITYTGGLYIYDLATGNQDQLYVTSNYIACAPVVSGGFAFIYDRMAKVVKRVQLSDGSVTHTLSGLSVIDIETMGWDTENSRLIVPIATAIRSYNMSDLSQAWTYAATYSVGNAPSPLVVGDYVYFKANGEQVLKKLAKSDGAYVNATANLGSNNTTYAGPIYDPDHDYIYVPGASAQVHCIDPSDMSIVWSKTVGSGMGTPFIHNSIGYHNGKVFVPCRDDGANYKAKLYILDYSNGDILYTNTSAWDDGQDFTTMLLTADRIYIPGCNYSDLYNAKLYIILQSDGSLESSQALAYSAACGGVACVSEGLVIVNELDGFVECFDLGSGSASDSEHYMKNLYHNGYSGDRLVFEAPPGGTSFVTWIN